MIIHEFVESARLLDDFLARAKVEMIGIGQHDARTARGYLLWGEAFDGGVRPYGHEHRRLNVAMRRMQNAITGTRFLVDVEDFQIEVLCHSGSILNAGLDKDNQRLPLKGP